MPEDSVVTTQRDILELEYGEHLFVWALRRTVIQRDACPVVAREFADACGQDARAVLITFRIFLETLGHTARRRLSVGYPGCLHVTIDETRLLSLVAAAQNDDQPRLDALLRWIARTEGHHRLAVAIRALATAFAIHNLRITSLAPTPVAGTANRVSLARVS